MKYVLKNGVYGSKYWNLNASWNLNVPRWTEVQRNAAIFASKSEAEIFAKWLCLDRYHVVRLVRKSK